MNSENKLNINKKTPSQLAHYIGILAFGWLYSFVLNVLILGAPFTIYAISNALGGGVAFLLVGWLFTAWKGKKIGWVMVLIFAFFMFMGATPQ